jgi:hypothetical protein
MHSGEEDKNTFCAENKDKTTEGKSFVCSRKGIFMRVIIVLILILLPTVLYVLLKPQNGLSGAKSRDESTFYGEALVNIAKTNVETQFWAKQVKDNVLKSAASWINMSDDDLWSAMFGPTLERSWMVWSDGYCPACKQSVPMYKWVIDPFKYPWKAVCPNCGEVFPKNDFGKYYYSGLDEHGIFDPKLADRSLLFNEEHPDPAACVVLWRISTPMINGRPTEFI